MGKVMALAPDPEDSGIAQPQMGMVLVNGRPNEVSDNVLVGQVVPVPSPVIRFPEAVGKGQGPKPDRGRAAAALRLSRRVGTMGAGEGTHHPACALKIKG
jgi:hypothetical protein